MDKNEHNLLINIKDLTWWYSDSPYLLFNKFNFALYKNDFSVLVWKSWTWKSTLIKFLIGQIKVPPRTIYHKLEDMSKYSDDDIQMYRRKLGIVFQDAKLLDHLSVKENVIYPLRIYDLWEHIIESKFQTVCDILHLAPILDTPIYLLSAWEKQKIAIARAIIHDPELIIADEPAGNLDWETTQQIADILLAIHKQGKAVLLITHDIHLLNYIKTKEAVTLYQI